MTYEDVDTSLIPPRPRLYGLVGAEVIEEVWKQRQAAKAPPRGNGANGAAADGASDERVDPSRRRRPRVQAQARMRSDDVYASHNDTDSDDATTKRRRCHGDAIRRRAAPFDVRVLRQDGPGEPAIGSGTRIAREPDMNVISVLQRIAAQAETADGRKVAPVAWDCNCLEEVCGACTMVINGHVRQACTALVDRLLADNPDEIELRPMTSFRSSAIWSSIGGGCSGR